MLKNFKFLGILIILLLCAPALSHAQYYCHYAGVAFTPGDDTDVYEKYISSGLSYIGNEGTTGGTTFFCPVDFLVGGYYMKEMSVRYWDATSTDYLRVRLKRMHLPTGSIQTVATFSTTGAFAQAAWNKAHVAPAAGTKYINSEVWTYWLELYFSGGASYLALAQVRIRYWY